MNSRVSLLFGAMLASSAWSQEPATDTPPPSRLAFDLRSDSIKKIVQDNAATQSALVQLSNEKPVEREPIANIDLTPPVEKPLPEYPTRLPDPAPESTGFFSTLVETLVDTWLDVEDDPMPGEYDNWLSCQAQDDLKTATQSSTCPSASPKVLRGSGK